MENKKLEEILNKDKKFLLVMIPVILILSLVLAYAFVPSLHETGIEDNIISLIEKSTNDTLSLLVQEDSNNDSNDIESDVVSSQNTTNRGSNQVSGSTGTDTGTATTDEGNPSSADSGTEEPVNPVPADNPGSDSDISDNPGPVNTPESEGS